MRQGIHRPTDTGAEAGSTGGSACTLARMVTWPFSVYLTPFESRLASTWQGTTTPPNASDQQRARRTERPACRELRQLPNLFDASRRPNEVCLDAVIEIDHELNLLRRRRNLHDRAEWRKASER